LEDVVLRLTMGKQNTMSHGSDSSGGISELLHIGVRSIWAHISNREPTTDEI
jgi:hypothetical protein